MQNTDSTKWCWVRTSAVACAFPLLSGCLLNTAADVVTAPVRVIGKGVDLVTTSQSESDQKRGRALRKREERLGRLERDYRAQQRDCERGQRKACEKARRTYAEIRELLPTVPYEPED